MNIYRLEHKISKLGPYEHNNREQKALKFIIDMEDIDSKIIKKLLKRNNILFGWKTKKLCFSMCKDYNKLKSLGFRIVRYVQCSLFTNVDGQVIFKRKNKK